MTVKEPLTVACRVAPVPYVASVLRVLCVPSPPPPLAQSLSGLVEFRPVSLLSPLRPGLRPAGGLRAAVTAPPSAPASLPGAPQGRQLGIASPWSSVQLSSIVWQDLLGLDREKLPVTRAEAMAVPAIARARHIITGTAARDELRAYRGDGEQAVRLLGAEEPSWIGNMDGELSPFHRMLWTFDDLFFHGWSLWSRVNSAPDATGRRLPLRMDRVAIDRWGFDGDGHVLVDSMPVRNEDVVVIPGPHEGLLNFGAGAVRHAADLQRAAGRAAKHPAAFMALKYTGTAPMKREDIDQVVADWAAAREGFNGGVAWLPPNVEAKELGTFDKHLVVDGRNAAAVDAARAASLPADTIDADPGFSMTYTNSQDNDRRLIDYGVGFYMAAVSAQLSMNATSPRGQRVVFGLEEWLNRTVPGQDPIAVTRSAAPQPTQAQPVPSAPVGAPQ